MDGSKTIIIFAVVAVGVYLAADLLFSKGKKKNKDTIDINTTKQADMYNKLNDAVNAYTIFAENLADLIDDAEKDDIRLNEEDFNTFEKKVKQGLMYKARLEIILKDMASYIQKNQKLNFDRAFKDYNIYIKYLDTIGIELATIINQYK